MNLKGLVCYTENHREAAEGHGDFYFIAGNLRNTLRANEKIQRVTAFDHLIVKT
jgi:hypothetical protein